MSADQPIPGGTPTRSGNERDQLSVDHHVDPQVYFSIGPGRVGFTDQMVKFSAFYKLGLSLGYRYIHVPFKSDRSSFGPDSVLPNIPKPSGSIGRRLASLVKISSIESDPDIYQFLGFNALLLQKNPQISQDQLDIVEVPLCDEILKCEGITTIEKLQDYVRAAVDGHPGTKPTTLARFVLRGKRHFFAWIHAQFPNYQDGLNLRESYFHARRTHPWPSRFIQGNIKLLVHIRQGDKAVIRTPWDTFIPIWKKRTSRLTEHQHLNEIEGDKPVQVEDYYDFVRKISLGHKTGAFSILCFSDGYQRAFEVLRHNIDRLNYTPRQARQLLKSRKTYDQKAFKGFSGLPNCSVVVGEHFAKLRALIHSAMECNIVVIGFQQRMIPKVLANYCDAKTMPIVVVLHTGTKPDYSNLGWHEREAKCLYVNVLHGEVADVMSQLDKLLAH